MCSTRQCCYLVYRVLVGDVIHYTHHISLCEFEKKKKKKIRRTLYQTQNSINYVYV